MVRVNTILFYFYVAKITYATSNCYCPGCIVKLNNYYYFSTNTMVPGQSASAANMVMAMMAKGIAASWLGEIDTVNNHLDEGDIILHKHGTRLIKSSLSHEHWVSTGEVHLGRWPLEE